MQVPLLAPSPVVAQHAPAFQELFDNHCQYDHFQNYLTGLMVLPNKSLSNIARCFVESADKTNLARFMSQAPWCAEAVNDRRIEYLLTHTEPYRRAAKHSQLIFDDTLCEHFGSLFEHVARHYDHCEGRYPIAHNVVTSHFVSGQVRFPIHWRVYRRFEEKTRWEFFLEKHFPDLEIPKKSKERNKLHQELDEQLGVLEPEFARLAGEFQTKIELAVELIEDAVARGLPFQVCLMDSWYVGPEVIACLTRHKLDWVSLLKKNRKLETGSFTLRDGAGNKVKFAGPQVKVEELVKLMPASAFREVKAGKTNYWCFGLNVRIPGWGKVRLVVSYGNAELSGTYAVLVSNRTDWSVEKVLATYLQRWPIETFYQDSKGHLGLDEYRMRKMEAIEKHWCLVFVAYSLLHLECLLASPKKRSLLSTPVKTIGEACRQQGQALIEELIMHGHQLLQAGASAREVMGRLFAKQQPVMVC
jgi:SRSO17 transposase